MPVNVDTKTYRIIFLNTFKRSEWLHSFESMSHTESGSSSIALKSLSNLKLDFFFVCVCVCVRSKSHVKLIRLTLTCSSLCAVTLSWWRGLRSMLGG